MRLYPIVRLILEEFRSKISLIVYSKRKIFRDRKFMLLMMKLREKIFNLCWQEIVFSVLFSCITYFSVKIGRVYNGTVEWREINVINLELVDCLFIVLWFLLGVVLFKCFDWVTHNFNVCNLKKTFAKPKMVGFVSFILNIVSWGIQLLVFNPGCGFADTYIILNGYRGMKHQHPIVYIYYLAGLMRVFLKKTGNINTALMMIVCIQIVIISALLAWSVYYLAYKGVRKEAIMILVLYYAFWPLVGRNSITLLKDPLFAAFVLVLSLSLFEMVSEPKSFFKSTQNVICFICTILGTALSRSNGVYVVVASLLFVMFSLKTKEKVILLVCVIGIMLLNSWLTKDAKGLAQEALAIPIQQSAMVAALDENREEPETFIDALSYSLPYEQWGQNYAIGVVDSIKWNSEFDHKAFTQHKNEFLREWMKGIPRNFKKYCVAYMYQTYYIWCDTKPFMDNTSFQSYFYYMDGVELSHIQKKLCKVQDERGIITHQVILPDKINNMIYDLSERFCKFLSAGICLIITLIGVFLFSNKKQYKKLIFVLPGFLTWGTLMASVPAASSFRYVDHYVLVIPVLLLFMFMQNEEIDYREKEEDK